MGLAAINDWSTQNPFIDLMKQSRAWHNWAGGSNQFVLDKNDWPLSLVPQQEAGTVFLVSGNKPLFEQAIVLYEGEGVIEYRWSAKKITAESTPGRDVIGLGKGNHLLVITQTNPKNPLRNIRIIPHVFLTQYQQGEIFNPEWVQKIAPFTALRFMDWMKTNNSTLKAWPDRPNIGDRSWAIKGVPLEVMVALANKTHTHAWFNMPHMADANYMDEFAALAHKQLNKPLKIYVEHSNEVWNWQFKQASYAKQQGDELVAPQKTAQQKNARMQWHGIKTAQICDAFKNAKFGDSAKRVVCVLGMQAAWHGLEQEALTCPGWQLAPCYKHGFDAIAIAAYFTGYLNGPMQKPDVIYEKTLKTWASLGINGVSAAFEQLTHGQLLRQIEPAKKYQGVVAELTEHLNYWVPAAHKYKMTLVAYEGGAHITANAHVLQDDPAIVAFHLAINRDANMANIYQQLFKTWQAQGGGLFMHFVDVAAPSKYGSWGALENFKQVTSPKWQAITQFNAQVKCWWPDCNILMGPQ